MINIQLPNNHFYNTFSFYYCDDLCDTFIEGEKSMYIFQVTSDVVDIRDIDLDVFYVFMYYRKSEICGKKRIHTHTHSQYQSFDHHINFQNRVLEEIDKVKDNMPIKNRKSKTLSKELY